MRSGCDSECKISSRYKINKHKPFFFDECVLIKQPLWPSFDTNELTKGSHELSPEQRQPHNVLSFWQYVSQAKQWLMPPTFIHTACATASEKLHLQLTVSSQLLHVNM